MSDRVACKVCGTSILEVTAKYNDGMCAPCVQAKASAANKAYIEANKIDVDLYAGVTDDVEIVCLLLARRGYDPLKNYLPYFRTIEETFLGLSEKDTSRLIDKAIVELHSGDKDLAESIIVTLACFSDVDLEEYQVALMETGEASPDIIFRGASDFVTQKLIDSLQDEEGALVKNSILCALAFSGNKAVVQLFNKWREYTPKWADELYIHPADYSDQAGWVMRNGLKQDLYYQENYPLHKENQKGTEAIRITSAETEQCPCCHAALTVFMDLDLTLSTLSFLNIPGSRLRIVGCQEASCYGVNFMDVDYEGGFTWSLVNKPDCTPGGCDDWEGSQALTMFIGERRAYSHTSYSFIPATISQIGGLPMWVQDAEYPQCPKCSEKMTFIGQLDNEEIADYSEGLYYTFLCKPCKVTAVSFQQT